MSPGICIVGISVELPSGAYSKQNLDHESFFDFLLNSGQAYEQLPRDRFNVDGWKGNGIGQIHVDKGAFLKDIDQFDNVEFGISSRDARTMAPVTRKILENCFLALLDSGIDYRSRNVGCYTSGNSFDLSNVAEPDEYEPQGSFAGYTSMLANRVSNHLDLLGPSVPTDTACSSTLTALHLAVQAILNGECEAAVVGGCQLNHRLMDWIAYSQGSILAKDGKCKPFDISADGFARAEGCVAVVLKPVQDALRDHDHIYATILGTAINNGGAGAPPGAPVADSQCDAMLQAFHRAEKCPKDVDYVELHATGTAKGDPTEANWVGKQFQRDDEVLIGSVKGNIGHTEVTAFLASLSKVLSILQRGIIPPTANLTDLNPAIKWTEYNLRVPTSPTPLPQHTPDRYLVSMAGSGIGGSNGHVILESAPPRKPLDAQVSDAHHPVLLLAGGLSPRSVAAVADSISASLTTDHVDAHLMATVLGRRAKQMTWRSYAISHADTPIRFSEPQRCQRSANPIVFVFSGQGPQHVNMGRELFKTFPAFRDSVLEMDETYKTITGKSIMGHWGLFSGDGTIALPDVWPISLTLPSIAIFQIALFDLLVHLNIRPDIVIGHSAGETAVLYASGAGSKALAVELAILRGSVFSVMESHGGAMAALSCATLEATQMLEQVCAQDPGHTVEIACYNAPAAVAIAGHESAVDQVVELAKAQGVYARKLPTRVPIHSSLMEACREEYCAGLCALFARYPGARVPNISTYSTFTGGLFAAPFDADYFWKNTIGEVRFTEAVEAITSSGSHTFVELAPRPVLSSYIRSMAEEPHVVLPTVRRARSGQESSEYRDILELCGQLTIAGHNCIDFTALNGRACYDAKLSMPRYPFLKKQFPLYPDSPGTKTQLEHRLGPLNHARLRVNKETHPSLGEHVIRDEPIMPAAGFVETALEFGARILINVNFRSILSLSADRPIPVQVQLEGSFWTIKSAAPSYKKSASMESNSVENLHADGFLSFEVPPEYPDLDVSALRKRLPNQIGSGFYPSLSYFSSYGPRIRRVTNVYFGRNEALVSINGMDEILFDDAHYFLHPAILDASFHVLDYRPFHGNFDPNVYYLPAHIDAVIINEPLKPNYFPAHVYAYVEWTAWHPNHMRYDITIVNDLGKRLCMVQGLRVARHHINPASKVSDPLEIVLQPTSIPPFRRTDEEILIDTHRSRQRDEASDEPKLYCRCGNNGVLNGSNIQCARHPHDAQSSSPETNQRCLTQKQTADHGFVELLHDVLVHMSCRAQLRIIRVLAFRSDPVTLQYLAQAMNRFQAVFFDLYIDSEVALSTLQLAKFSGTVRPVAFDVQHLAEGTDHVSSFEVVLASRDESSHVPPELLIQSFDSILVPGGMLVLSEDLPKALDHSLLSSHRKGIVADHIQHASTAGLSPVLEALVKSGFSVVQTHQSDSGNFVITQKHIPEAGTLYIASEAFVFQYEYGNEIELQWEFSGLNIRQDLAVWILATEGPDGGSAMGLVRALRREYSFWTIRLVVFPSTYSESLRHECLQRVPVWMKEELDIVVSHTGDFMVPRMAPLGRFDSVGTLDDATHDIPNGHVLAHVLNSSRHRDAFVVMASVINANTTSLEQGSILLAMVTAFSGSSVVLDVTRACPVNPSLLLTVHAEIHTMAARLTAVLAPGLPVFRSPARLQSLRILLTHADNSFGRIIQNMYAEQALQFSRTPEGISMLGLAQLEDQPFDLIISGYEDDAHQQFLRSLLRPGRGKLFLWGSNITGLHELVHTEPHLISDALNHILQSMNEQPCVLDQDVLIPSSAPSRVVATQVHQQPVVKAVTLKAEQTYLIVGGIGSIGAQIALYLYQRGARHIVVSSRTGEKGLHANKNHSVYRVFEYLRSLNDLDIRLAAVDATSRDEMKMLVDSIQSKIAGCIILTAVLSDRVFQHLEDDQFKTVFASKTGVLDVARDIMNVSNLEFLVAFSSVSGLFGVSGQSNYAAANTALEQVMSTIPNGFCFVCPGILDSSLMLANERNVSEHRLDHFIEWSMTTEDMILWFDDAMMRYQSGQKFSCYTPTLNWDAMNATHGMTRVGLHLIPTRTTTEPTAANDVGRIADIIKHTLNISPDDFSDGIPLTFYGLDSLSASRLSFMLRPIISVTQIQLLADMSLRDIQSRLSVDTGTAYVQSQEPTTGKTNMQAMRDMLSKYTQDLPERRAPTDPQARRDEIVLLTGSTGTFGVHILAKLLGRNDITKVFAINRRRADGSGLFQRQVAALVTQGLSPALASSSKLVLIEGDLLMDDFGIPSDVINEISSSVTHIIHNAWTVDFMLSLDEMEGLVKYSRRLLDLATVSTHMTPPSISFISTIGIYQHHLGSDPAPEAPVLDARMAVQTGYIESKWVAERLLQVGGAKLGLKTHVIRVGLLSGAANGSWDTSHWLPALAQSATYVGCLPEGDSLVSWIPVELAAAAVVDLRHAPDGTFHVVHPHPASWSDIMAPLAYTLDVPLVPYEEWFYRLENMTTAITQSASQPNNRRSKQALRLVDFYRLGMRSSGPHSRKESMGLIPQVECRKAMQSSPALQNSELSRLQVSDVERWVSYWRRVGFLPFSDASN